MSESVKLSFYRVHECGYYSWGNNTPVFGSLQELLTDLHLWCTDKSIENTKLYEPQAGSDYMATYLLDINRLGDDWLVTTWNEVPSTEAGVASVMRDSSVTAPDVVMNQIQDNSIPGYATYFWILPSYGLFASLRFKNRTQTGQPPFRKYIEQALSLISSYVRYGEDEEDGSRRVIGYAPTGEDLMSPSPSPRFKTSLAYDVGNREYIRENANRVNKIIRKETLRLNHADERQWWQSALSRLGISSGNDYRRMDEVNVRYELRPDFFGLQDIDSMMQEWDDSEHVRSEWDDYGFTFKGNAAKVHWLSHSTLTASAELNVIWDNNEVVNGESLLSVLTAGKAVLLQQIREE
ncbi:hypothetical protein [Klebsiella quasipneumoniae]|uniref:hypothetical protein n=1 Tax=Klebsiella quasipneumoniae TaxID=1463165 RepID=UPI00384DBB6E